MRRTRRRDERVIAFDGPSDSASTSSWQLRRRRRIGGRNLRVPSHGSPPDRQHRLRRSRGGGTGDLARRAAPRARAPHARASRGVLVVNHRALAESDSRSTRRRAGAGARPRRRRVRAASASGYHGQNSPRYRVACGSAATRVVTFGRRCRDPDRLVYGDALRDGRRHRDGALDAIYIDPPFGTGKRAARARPRYADRADDPDAFVAWLSPYLEHSRRVLAPTRLARSCISTTERCTTSRSRSIACSAASGSSTRSCGATAVGGKSRRGFGRKHDTILWYARSADWAFYPDAVRVPRRAGSHMRLVDGVQEKTDRKTGRVYRYPVRRRQGPRGLVDRHRDAQPLRRASAPAGHRKSRSGSSSACCRAVTRSGDRVADWFAGSGTTAAVAQRLGSAIRGQRSRARRDSRSTTARLVAQGRRLAAAGKPASASRDRARAACCTLREGPPGEDSNWLRGDDGRYARERPPA